MSNERLNRKTVPKSRRLSFPDLLGESLAALVARPGRSSLTGLGTVLGVAALVATLGVSQSAAAQIGFELDALRPTSVSAAIRAPVDQSIQVSRSLPNDAVARAQRLNGVIAAATITEVLVDAFATAHPNTAEEASDGSAIQVFAISSTLMDVIDGQLTNGIFLDLLDDSTARPVAVLGPLTAQRLNMAIVNQQPAFFVGTRPLNVIGILRDKNLPEGLADAVLISHPTAKDMFGWDLTSRLLIRTEIGAAQHVASEIRIALSPDAPENIEVLVPREPRAVRTAVEDQVDLLIAILGGIGLLIGGLGIANVTLVSVLERTNEIGVRRALGARRSQIALQFLAESAVLGGAGGALGSSLGVGTIVTIAASRHWVPVMEAWIPFSAPLGGVVIGLLAGLYPALRAASMDAARAIRSGVS